MKILLKILLVLVLLITIVLFLIFDTTAAPAYADKSAVSTDTILEEELIRYVLSDATLEESLQDAETTLNDLLFATYSYSYNSTYDPTCSNPECSYWMRFGGFSDINAGITGVWSELSTDQLILHATLRSDYFISYSTIITAVFDVVDEGDMLTLSLASMKLGKIPIPGALVGTVAAPILATGGEDTSSAPGVDMNMETLVITINKTILNQEFSVPSIAVSKLEGYYPAYIMMMWLQLENY